MRNFTKEALEDELDEILSEVLVQETPAAEKQEDVLGYVLDDVKTGGDVALPEKEGRTGRNASWRHDDHAASYSGAALEKPEESAGPVLSKQKPAKKPSQKKPEEKNRAAPLSLLLLLYGASVSGALDEKSQGAGRRPRG